jgi:hypothetical protein
MFCSNIFFTTHKSDILLVNDFFKKFSFTVIKQKFLFEPIIREARQIYLKKELKFVFKHFNYKIKKTSSNIQKNFTLKKFKKMIIFLEFILSNFSRTGYFNYNLYNFFCNPCFLLNVIIIF